MINVIKQFFEKNIKSPDDKSEEVSEHSLQIATAALLTGMMRADAEITRDEQKTIIKSIRSKFNLSGEETDSLLKLAEEEVQRATGYYEFTYLINKGFTYKQKVKVIELLWEVAFADSHLDKYEEHMVRKITDLIYVSHKDFIETKLRVRDKEKNRES
jgi:uncharacterized tellurite resistance protein B-like protein